MQMEFLYNKLELDNNFTIKPLNFSDKDLVDIELILDTDEKNKIVKKVTNDSFTSVNKDVPLIEEETISPLAEKSKTKDTQKKSIKSAVKVSTPSPKWNNDEAIQVLQFDFNSYFLDSEDWSRLHRVATILRRNPSYKAELIGHTDTTGSEAANIDISTQRAKQAKIYLTKIGIDAERISTKGMKDTQPVTSNSTWADRAKNRRVEVYIH